MFYLIISIALAGVSLLLLYQFIRVLLKLTIMEKKGVPLAQLLRRNRHAAD